MRTLRGPLSAPSERAARLRFVLTEAAGALGDLGTFVPIVLGMVVVVGLDAGTVLVFAGLMNVLAGLFFRIPIAVQPMKAICALAIAGSVGASQVAVGGVFAGVCLLGVGLFGLTGLLDRLVPRAVLRAFQATVGIHLLLTGFRFGLFVQGGEGLRPLLGPEGLVVFAGSLVVVIGFRRNPARAILGLIVLGFAVAWHRVSASPAAFEGGIWVPRLAALGSGAVEGIWLAGLPQLPLTLLNSVLAVSLLAGELFPESRKRTSPRKIAISVGIMNLVACPLGAMPMCHGSGGLAGQHRFGARTSLSVVMLGTAKIGIGLLAGAAAVAWMRAFPMAILGVFLIVAGAALAGISRFWQVRRSVVAGSVMVAVHLATGMLVLGFASGWVAHAIVSKVESGREQPAASDVTGGGRDAE